MLLASSLLAACTTAGVAEPAPTPSPPLSTGFQPTRPPFNAGLPTQAPDVPYVIERVTLTTNVDGDGVPVDEVTVIPADSRTMFLSVLVTGLEEPATFRAFWYEGDSIIGQSEVEVEEPEDIARWVSLSFRIDRDLDPSQRHAVELRIDERVVDIYTFRVGTGSLANVIASTTLALGTRDGEPVSPGEVFDIFAPQIVLIVQISEQIDPSAMVFSSFLYHGDEMILQRGPDGGQPQLPAEPTDDDRRITFTFVPDSGFAPGDYQAVLLVNGIEVLTVPFTVTSDQIPTPTPVQPTAGPTPTPVASGVSLQEIRVTDELDPQTAAPQGESIDAWDGQPNQQEEFWVSLRLADLRIDDVVELDVLLWDRHINRHRFPVAAFDQGWLSVPVNLWAPAEGDGPKEYTFLVFINGVQLRSYVVMVDNDPEPTPTPETTETPEAAGTATPEP